MKHQLKTQQLQCKFLAGLTSHSKSREQDTDQILNVQSSTLMSLQHPLTTPARVLQQSGFQDIYNQVKIVERQRHDHVRNLKLFKRYVPEQADQSVRPYAADTILIGTSWSGQVSVPIEFPFDGAGQVSNTFTDITLGAPAHIFSQAITMCLIILQQLELWVTSHTGFWNQNVSGQTVLCQL